MDALYDLKDKLCQELEEYGDKELSAGSLSTIDSLAHTIKNLDKIIEKYDESEYSGATGYTNRMSYGRGGYSNERGGRDGYSNERGGYSNENYSMARGRGSNARRDSRGRYSSEGYSGHDMVMELRDLMEDAPDERTRMEFEKFIRKMEQM